MKHQLDTLKPKTLFEVQDFLTTRNEWTSQWMKLEARILKAIKAMHTVTHTEFPPKEVTKQTHNNLAAHSAKISGSIQAGSAAESLLKALPALNGNEFRAAHVKEITKMNHSDSCNALHRLLQLGKIEKVGKGKYRRLINSVALLFLFCLSASANQVTMLWDSVDSATSYHLYIGTVSGDYTQFYDTTNTTCTVTGLADGTTYYFAVTADDSTGEFGESDLSSEVVVTTSDSSSHPVYPVFIPGHKYYRLKIH